MKIELDEQELMDMIWAINDAIECNTQLLAINRRCGHEDLAAEGEVLIRRLKATQEKYRHAQG